MTSLLKIGKIKYVPKSKVLFYIDEARRVVGIKGGSRFNLSEAKGLKTISTGGQVSALTICAVLGVKGQRYLKLPLKVYEDNDLGDIVYFKVPITPKKLKENVIN